MSSYTIQELKALILPMVESVITKEDAVDCTNAIVDLIKQDREAQ